MTGQVFVARERELSQLRIFLDRALNDNGQVCFVIGEAGSGKTALLTEFARRAQQVQPDLLVAIGNCNAQTGIGDPYLPFREILGQLTGDVDAKLAQGAMTQENANRLRAFLARSGQVLIEVAPDLIDVMVPGSRIIGQVGTTLAEKFGWVDKLKGLVEQKQKDKTRVEPFLEQNRLFEQYTRALTAMAAEQPLMIVLDDLQWADAASISLLFHLGRSVRESRILLIGAYRPNEVALGRGDDRHPLEQVSNELRRYFGDIWIDLAAAAQNEARHFVDAILDTQPNRLSEETRQSLFLHTEGHPLFTIELIQDMQERGDLVQDANGDWVEGDDLDWDTLPARVEAVIAERISRLEDEQRQVLDVGSVEGEEFTAQVVAHIQAINERQLLRALSQELEKLHQLVREQGEIQVQGQALTRYKFAHALFQHYLYSELSNGERRILHGDIGRVLEQLFAGQESRIAVQLARHFDEARISEKAIHYRYLAGQGAAQLSAHDEAIAHFQRGLELIDNLPDSDARSQHELMLQIGLGNMLIATKGYGAPEVGVAYSRARELIQYSDSTPRLFAIMRGFAMYYLTRAQHQTARELAEDLITRIEQTNATSSLTIGHSTLGMSLYYLGEFTAALEHLELGIAHYDPDQHPAYAMQYAGADSKVSCLTYGGLALWALGYQEQAVDKNREAIALARELNHTFSLAFTLQFATFLSYLRRDVQATQELCEEVLALSRVEGFSLWITFGSALQGWVLTEQGVVEAGIGQIRRSLTALQRTGQELGRHFVLAILADVYRKTENPREGLTVIGEGLEIALNNHEHFFLAESYRIKGELLLLQDKMDAEAEACFREAIAIAQRQQAKSWELNATASLCRLLQKQGRQPEGLHILSAIYGWFSEGFDDKNLRSAKILLDSLPKPTPPTAAGSSTY